MSCDDAIYLPKNLGDLHYELELAVLITERLSNITVAEAKLGKYYFAVALDLTLRDLQFDLKSKGLPWEKAKAFDGSCVISPWTSRYSLADVYNLCICLDINGQQKQSTIIKNMMVPIPDLISHISQFFTLLPGDVVLTGTPKGVGKLNAGDKLSMSLNNTAYNVVVKG